MNNSNATREQSIDILILHGLSKGLVDYLRSVFSGLGLTANSPLDLPSAGLRQEGKVDYYIRSCRIPLVLVSFDEEDPASVAARPNVYDEIARCQQLRREDTIVLREIKAGHPVRLPSNVEGQLVLIPFSRDVLHEMIPSLLTEIRDRIEFVERTAPESEELLEDKDEAQLMDFITQMDGLWDSEFDQAWNKIHQSDFMAESDLAVELDKFFQHYHKVFSELVRNRLRGQHLAEICKSSLSAAWNSAAQAWEVVVKAKVKHINDEAQKGTIARRKKLNQILSEATTEVRRGQRARDNKESINHYRKALAFLEASGSDVVHG